MPDDEERLEKLLKERGVTDPEQIEEYKKGFRMVKLMFGDIPEYMVKFFEAVRKELSLFEEMVKKNFGYDWTEEDFEDMTKD